MWRTVFKSVRTEAVSALPSMTRAALAKALFRAQLNKVYRWYAGGFFCFVLVLAVLEQWGLSRE